MKMNLPNKLSVIRLFMVPVFVVIMMASDALWANLVGCALFGLAAFTDMLDGKIARKYNLITDFGKFLDPLADKFMVIGALLVILYKVMGDSSVNGIFTTVFFWTVMIVIFRELAVTSIRLVVSGSAGIVVAANILGKIVDVLCEDFDPVAEVHFGRSSADAPEIDGKVYFRSEERIAPGSFVRVKVRDVVEYDLYGNIVTRK